MADSPIQSYPDVTASANTKVFALNPGDEIGWVDYPDDAATETYVDGAVSDHNTDALAHGGVEGRMDTAETNITNNAAAIDGVDDAVDQRAPGVGGTTGQVWGKVSNADYDAAWIDASSGGVTAVSSVNGESGAVVLDPDDLNDAGTTNKFISATELLKLDGIEGGAQVNTISSVNGQTGVVSLDPDDLNDAATSHKFVSAAQVAAINALGSASTQSTTSFATAAQGALAASALQEVNVPDDIDAAGTPSSSTFLRGDGAWAVPAGGGGGGDVDSVNGQTGAVVIDADDISDSATTNKFASAAQLTKLSGIEAGAQVNDVSSVNGATGIVVLDPDDLNDAATTNKFVTQADLDSINSALQEVDLSDHNDDAAAHDAVVGRMGQAELDIGDNTSLISQNAADIATNVAAIDALGPFVYDEVGDLPGGTPFGTVFFVRNADPVPPVGGPPLVRDIAFNLYGGGNPNNADLPDYEEGDMLLAICKTQGTNNDQLTATGWTPAAWGDGQAYTDTRYLQILTRTATASETDPISLNHGGSGVRVVTAVMSIQNAGSIDAFSIFTQGAGDEEDPIAPSVTALSDDSLALVFAGGTAGGPNVATTTGASNGFAEELNVTSPASPGGSSNDGLSIYSKDVDTGVVGTCQVTFTGATIAASGAGMIVIGPAA